MLIRLGYVATRRAMTGVAHTLVMLAIFIAIGLLRWPLVPVVLVMAPISVAIAWRGRTKRDA
jgi:chromate transporter